MEDVYKRQGLGMALHQLFQHLGGQEDPSHHACSQGNQGQYVQGAYIFNDPLIDPQHVEHLGNTDPGQHQAHRYDDPPGQLNERCAYAKAAVWFRQTGRKQGQ